MSNLSLISVVSLISVFELEMIKAPGASDTRRQGADPGEGG
jgi:hypothetical protein